MSNPDPTQWPVTKMSAGIAGGRISPVDLVDAFLARTAQRDEKLHAYVEIYARDARLAAEAADKAIRSGHGLGPLHGIPIAIKDLVEIDGRTVTDGCSVWRDRQSTGTATVARRLIERGVITLGKTHMVEFAFGGWGTNTRMGTPWNPWDTGVARAPGGSSSGSAVAIAGGLAPWAVGTDTGGSVRLPASWCGLTSLKVSIGRISTYGVLPLSPTLDTPGPMARSVRDVAMLYAAMQGADPHDPRTLGVPAASDFEAPSHGVAGMRLARLPDAERAAVANEVLEAYDRSLDELANLGAEITDVALPITFADIASLNGQIMAAESYALFARLVDDDALALDEDVRPRVLAGREISAYAYLSALARRQELTEQVDQAIAGIDALLTPTTTTTAPRLVDIDQYSTPAHFTRFANFFNLCALAIPNGSDSQGLPTSLQVIGHRYGEADVLRVGHAYQVATDWHTKTPRDS